MIPRKIICEFFELYPWNSTEIQLDFDDDFIQAAFDKVAEDLIFDEIGRRFYDYLRGHYDATVPLSESNRMPNPDKDPEAVTKWIKKEFEPKDLLQFFFVISLPGITAQLIYDTLSGKPEEEKILQEVTDIAKELLTSDTEFSKKVQEEFYEFPESDEIFEKIKNLE
jgi:hypothetical protein